MGIELSESDRAGMTPAEIEALTSENAEAHLRAHGAEDAGAAEQGGEDGADTERQSAKTDDPAPKGGGTEASAATGEEEDLPGAEDLMELLGSDAAPQPLTVEGPKDFKAERQALRDKKAEVEKQWAEAQITDEQRATALQQIDDQIDDLLIAHTRAETLRNYNAQQAEAQMNAAVTNILKQAKAAGTIDYAADQKAAVQFDQMLSMHAADPDNAGKSAAELAALAHRSVLAFRGIVEKAKAEPTKESASDATTTAPAKRDAPITLAGLPNAERTVQEDSVLDKFKTLSGEDAEDYLASLSPADQQRVLRAADATAMQHSNDSRNLRRQRIAARS